MLLFLLAIVSSTALLTGTASAMVGKPLGFQSIVAVLISLALAAANFSLVQWAGLRLAKITSGLPEDVQGRYGKVFFLVILLWAGCASLIGFWTARLVCIVL
jgi:hypothetical protein